MPSPVLSHVGEPSSVRVVCPDSPKNVHLTRASSGESLEIPPTQSPIMIIAPTSSPSGSFYEEYGLLIFAILAYSSVSLAVVYFNWWLFTSEFKYPVFVSWIQQVVGFILFCIGAEAAKYFGSWRPIFPPVHLDTTTLRHVLPLSISFVLTVGLSNICLQKTLISTYQVARSLTLLFVILLSYLLLRERQSPVVLFACFIMVVGFVIGALDPTTLSLGGLIAGGFSSFFQSLYNVLIKRTMPRCDGDAQLLLLNNVFLSSFLFLPMALVAEDLGSFRQAFGFEQGGSGVWVIWGGMFLSGLLGTCLNMTQYLVVKVTSPLTFNIVGFTKSLLQSLGGIVFLGDSVSLPSASGLLLCMCGSALYAKAKVSASKQAKAKEELPPPDGEGIELLKSQESNSITRTAGTGDSRSTTPDVIGKIVSRPARDERQG